MKFDSNKFINSIDNELKDFLISIAKKGLRLTLVGGAVRDFLLEGKIVKDLDFEVRSLESLESNSWEKYLRSHLDDFEELEYNVFRKRLQTYEVELSSPRLEVFNDRLDHKNFTCSFDPSLSYLDSFKRRDFACNSIGIELTVLDDNIQASLVDPFNGLDSLANKIIEPVSDDFSKDPVRFLRLIRFSLNFDLELSDKSKTMMPKFDLSELSYYYFFKEFFKCKKNKDFFKNLYSYIEDYNINVTDELLSFDELKFINRPIHGQDELVLYSSVYFSSEVTAKLIEKLHLPIKRTKSMIRFLELANKFNGEEKRLSVSDKKIEKLILEDSFILWCEYYQLLKSFESDLDIFNRFIKIDQSVLVSRDSISNEIQKLRENYSDQKTLWRYFEGYLALLKREKNS